MENFVRDAQNIHNCYRIHECVIYKNNDWITSTRIEECIRNNDVLI